MEAHTILGIDPGSGGGIAFYNYKSGLKSVKMPKMKEKKGKQELMDYLNYIKSTFPKPICFLEKVQSFHSDTDDAGKRFGIEKMLANFEQLKTILELSGIPYVLTYPQSWQGGLNLRKKGESKSQRKNRYKAAASKYYPEHKVTLWNSDAICILQFGRMKFNTDVDWIIERLPSEVQNSFFNDL